MAEDNGDTAWWLARVAQANRQETLWRKYLMRRRQCLIQELGQIEELLGLERSIIPKRKKG